MYEHMYLKLYPVLEDCVQARQELLVHHDSVRPGLVTADHISQGTQRWRAQRILLATKTQRRAQTQGGIDGTSARLQKNSRPNAGRGKKALQQCNLARCTCCLGCKQDVNSTQSHVRYVPSSGVVTPINSCSRVRHGDARRPVTMLLHTGRC